MHEWLTINKTIWSFSPNWEKTETSKTKSIPILKIRIKMTNLFKDSIPSYKNKTLEFPFSCDLQTVESEPSADGVRENETYTNPSQRLSPPPSPMPGLRKQASFDVTISDAENLQSGLRSPRYQKRSIPNASTSKDSTDATDSIGTGSNQNTSVYSQRRFRSISDEYIVSNTKEKVCRSSCISLKALILITGLRFAIYLNYF